MAPLRKSHFLSRTRLSTSTAALELIGHAPRRFRPVVINVCRHAAVKSVLADRLQVGAESGWQDKGFASSQYCPSHARVLGCNGHHRRPGPSPLLQCHCPVAQFVGLVLGCRQSGPRAHDQQAAQVGITRLGDASLGVSVMKSQLSNQQVITFNSVHYAVLVCYAA